MEKDHIMMLRTYSNSNLCIKRFCSEKFIDLTKLKLKNQNTLLMIKEILNL